jgi:hypothetical protein
MALSHGSGLRLDADCPRRLVRSARKAGAPPEEFLGHFAMACHRAKAAVSGALEPLYRLHASRLKLLMGPDPDLPVIARYCFLKSTAKQVSFLLLGSPRSASLLFPWALCTGAIPQTHWELPAFCISCWPVRKAPTHASTHSLDLRHTLKMTLMLTSHTTHMVKVLAASQMRTALQEGSESDEDKETAGEAVEVKVALYNDCMAAMAFVLDKERGFHRVRHAVARCSLRGSRRTARIRVSQSLSGVSGRAGVSRTTAERRSQAVDLCVWRM